MWHQWFNRNFMKLGEYFVHKENKNNDFNNSSPPNHVFRHYGEYHNACALLSSACKQSSAHSFRFYVSSITRIRCLHAEVLLIMAEDVIWMKRMLNKVFFFLLYTQKVFLQLRKSTVEPLMSCHMDCFIDVLTTFLGLGTFQLCCCLWRVRKLMDFIKNILICVPKMNEGLTGLKQHEGQ